MRSQPDYLRKSWVLQNKQDVLTMQRKISQSMFYYSIGSKPDYVIDIDFALKCYKDYIDNEPDVYKECERINNAFYKKRLRLRNTISNMLSKGQCLFLTFTFTDKSLNNLSAKTRNRYVRNFLASYNTQYVANIDFGGKNNREHYHAIILADHVDLKKWHKLGRIHVLFVKYDKDKQNDNTAEILAKYVAKLTNHAIKETTKRNCLIYSRSK